MKTFANVSILGQDLYFFKEKGYWIIYWNLEHHDLIKTAILRLLKVGEADIYTYFLRRQKAYRGINTRFKKIDDLLEALSKKIVVAEISNFSTTKLQSIELDERNLFD